jgi:plastocyanin
MNRGRWNLPATLALVLLVAAFGSACDDDGAKDDPTAAGDATVAVATASGDADHATLVRAVEGDGDPRDAWTFDPVEITVVTGTEITFTNDGDEVHTATADDGLFDTGTLNAGDSELVTFETAGTFNYHCSLHPWMTGEIVVTAAG